MASEELKQDFLVYAQEVNNNRAFPDARDGLKISQRAVLWEMFDKKYTSNKPHVKSAKVDGGVIANWHPHGSEYTTIVRMSQPWVNNIPEIDFHGANGSLIGGPDAAASRYTECRLSKVSEDGLFNAIDKKVVDFVPNYSEDQTWPAVFPAIFPRLFVNGSQGIGYTIAQEWEPGNLNEFVAKVKQHISKKKITFTDIYPDFPTGGTIINKKDLVDIYKTGKGKVILRGKTEILGKYINIYELPYQVYAEPFIQKVKDLVNSDTLLGVEDICNKSDDNGLFIEIECSSDPKVVLNRLYKLTDLQVTFNANQMALVDGYPQMLNLQDYIKVYVDHNIKCLVCEYTYDKEKTENRLEIVNGLLRALSIIDDIIQTIKAAKSTDEAKQKLIKKFSFTENQAKAIIDMKLGKLTNLEQKDLVNEKKELITTVTYCDLILGSEEMQNKEFLKRLNEFAKQYGWERRTEVTDVDLEEEKQTLKQEKQEEKFIIILDNDGKIRKISSQIFNRNKLNNTDIKFIEINKKDRFVLISNKGTMYKCEEKTLNTNVKQNLSGTLFNCLEKNEKIINIFTGLEDKDYLFFITKCGLAKKIEANIVFGLTKLAGAPVMKVNDKDEIIYCENVDDETSIKAVYNKKNKIIEVKNFIAKGRTAGGVVAIKTKPNTYIEIK